jgi:hypothetical protein
MEIRPDYEPLLINSEWIPGGKNPKNHRASYEPTGRPRSYAICGMAIFDHKAKNCPCKGKNIHDKNGD